MTCAPGEDPDQPSLTRVFAVRMKKPWVLSYPLSAQRRLIRLGRCPGWSESFWAHRSFCFFFVMRWLISNHWPDHRLLMSNRPTCWIVTCYIKTNCFSVYKINMSRLMAKPFARSDQRLRYMLNGELKIANFFMRTVKTDQTGQMPRLIWVFTGRTCHIVGFIMRSLNILFYHMTLPLFSG